MENLKKLIEKRNYKIAEMDGIVDKAKKEVRAMDEEETKLFDDLKSEVETLNNTIAAIEEVQKQKADASKKNENSEDEDNPAGKTDEDEKAEKEEEEKQERAFENYIRGYQKHERAGELVEGANGATIPKTIVQKIITKVYDVCPILEKSTRFDVKGDLEQPYYNVDDDKITMAYANEFVELTSHSGKFASITLRGFLAGALVKVSNKLINNSDFDVVNFVINEMAKSIARFIEHELLIGTDGKVAGLSTIKNTVTAANATNITADELIDLKDSIKDVYQNGAIWIMSSATRTAIRKLKDGNGRYLLQDDINRPFGSVIFGTPVYVSDNMPDMEAGKTAIYYGDMSCLDTKFTEDAEIQVLREKYATEHATGVVGWIEFDGKVADEQGLAKLVMGGTKAEQQTAEQKTEEQAAG